MPVTKKKETNSEAMARLEKIVSQIDNNELEIDVLAEKIKEANGIIAFCSDKLTKADKEIEKLKAIIRLNEINTKSKDDTIKRDRDTLQKLLKEIEELKSNNCVNKLKNERGAGRKEMFTEEQKARVKMLRLQGKSYRAIAKDMNCSVATVHKIINEQ